MNIMSVTRDVRSLYTNIPNDKVIDAFIGMFKEDAEPDNNTEEIITETFLLVTTKNLLMFNMVSINT